MISKSHKHKRYHSLKKWKEPSRQPPQSSSPKKHSFSSSLILEPHSAINNKYQRNKFQALELIQKYSRKKRLPFGKLSFLSVSYNLAKRKIQRLSINFEQFLPLNLRTKLANELNKKARSLDYFCGRRNPRKMCFLKFLPLTPEDMVQMTSNFQESCL